MGKKTAFPLAGLAFGGGGTSPMKARGWMGGPLGYSQPWKSLVCSHDANCLQPDTFLDLAERAEMRVRHLEAPPIPTSVLSKRGRGPIMCALGENRSRPAQDAWVCQVAGESQWLPGCQKKATFQGQGGLGWSPGPPREEAADGRLRNPLPSAWRKTGKSSPVTLRPPLCPYFTVRTLPHPHITQFPLPGFPQPGTSP